VCSRITLNNAADYQAQHIFLTFRPNPSLLAQ